MKMNIKKQLKDGNWTTLSLWINLIFIIIYLINEIVIFPIISYGRESLCSRMPYFLVTIKCYYALLMIVSILRIKKDPNWYWLLLNLASMGVLSIWFYSFGFYSSDLDIFLLELVAIWLLILTNLKSFVKMYEIKRTFSKTGLIVIIPVIISIMIYFMI